MNEKILVILIMIIICAPIIYGSYLQYRYLQPFSLYKVTTKEKWGRAAKVAFFLFLPFLVLGMLYPVITPEKNTPWWTSLYCVGFWLLTYPFIVLGLMIRFGFTESINNMMSRNIKTWNRAGYNFPFPTIFFPDKETQRFFREGFPDQIMEGEQRDIEALQKEKPVYQSPSPEKQWQLSIYGPTKKSPVFYVHFKNSSHIAEEYIFPFGFFEKHELLSVSWNLPNHVCGLYIAKQCYAMIYYGENPRPIGRYRTRTKKGNIFSLSAIAWFCNLGGIL